MASWRPTKNAKYGVGECVDLLVSCTILIDTGGQGSFFFALRWLFKLTILKCTPKLGLAVNRGVPVQYTPPGHC